MSESVEAIKKLIGECSIEECRALKSYLQGLLPHPLESEWGIDADTILSAINQSSDLTKRGIRGILAEAVFGNDVNSRLAHTGWTATLVVGDLSYDALVKKGAQSVRVQIKLQRTEKGVPKFYPGKFKDGSLYVVEVQKTRSGKRITNSNDLGTGAPARIAVETRPYHFGDFDILAVNMHPSSRDWKNFRYTLSEWLLPRKSPNESRIEIFQPVAAIPDDIWTDDLATCLQWFQSGEKRNVSTEFSRFRE